MFITEAEYVKVAERAAEIRCAVPEIAIMPDNFPEARSQKHLRVRREAIALRSTLEQANFPLGSFCVEAEHASFGEEDFLHWDASLFISASLMAREPYAIGIALSIVREHLLDYFAASPERTLRLTLIVERKRDRSCKKIVYEGSSPGLMSLAAYVAAAADE